MEIMPSEYQQIELSRSEKIFVRNVMGSERYGYLLAYCYEHVKLTFGRLGTYVFSLCYKLVGGFSHCGKYYYNIISCLVVLDTAVCYIVDPFLVCDGRTAEFLYY
jgi:hypothetical protein